MKKMKIYEKILRNFFSNNIIFNLWGILENAYKELLNPRAVNICAVMYFSLHYKAESCIYALKTLD